eukprot:m.122003 g.122003  ORF g.122003 m.122003 type:complete len:1345 (+) comp9305_c0_seq3:42-4076(+)
MALARGEHRLKVLEEIVKTEADYLAGLEMVCEHYIARMRGRKEFGEDVMSTLFSNFEEITAFHRTFSRELAEAYASSTRNIEACFIKHQDDFRIYSQFCSNHDKAMQQIYQLLEVTSARSFIKSCQLNSRTDLSLEAYILSVVQRICKYPLLLKELAKCSDDADHTRAQGALAAMKGVAEAVNEDKRRLEDLELIDAWQNTVENWAGPNLRDTSRHLIHDGTVVKFSLSKSNAASSHERSLFLFDNVLIYCKRVGKAKGARRPRSFIEGATTIQPTAEEENRYEFKGWIATRHLVAVDLEDGTEHVQTNGNPVTNAFKLSNQAKNKWYIFCCRTREEKEQWLAHLARERMRLATTQDGRLAAYDRIDKDGIHLREQFSEYVADGQKAIRDQKYNLKTYRACFQGKDLVAFLQAREWQGVASVDAAVRYGQRLLDGGVLHHVEDRRAFENSGYFYRFRLDDGTYRDRRLAEMIEQNGGQLYRRIYGVPGGCIIGTRTYLMKSYKQCFVGSELVDWLLAEGDVRDRAEGVQLGQTLLLAGFIEHVVVEHEFKDKHLFYRFACDHRRRMYDPMSAVDSAFTVTPAARERIIAIPRTVNGFGFVLEGHAPAHVRSVDAGSVAAQQGLMPGDGIWMVNDKDVRRCPHGELVSAIKGSTDILRLTVGVPENSPTNPCARCAYSFVSRDNQKVQVLETRSASTHTLRAAVTVINFLINDDHTIMSNIAKVTAVKARLQPVRDRLLKYLQQQRAEYTRHAASMAEIVATRRFRPLALAEDSAAAWAMMNCLTQSMVVTSERDDPAQYTVVRGAAFGVPHLPGGKTMPLTEPSLRETQKQEIDRHVRRLSAVHMVMASIQPATARAMHTFVAEGDGEISVQEGETVVIRHESIRGWCELVKQSGQRGRVPAADLERYGTLTEEQSTELRSGARSLCKLADRLTGKLLAHPCWEGVLPPEIGADLTAKANALRDLCAGFTASADQPDQYLTIHASARDLVNQAALLADQIGAYVYLLQMDLDDDAARTNALVSILHPSVRLRCDILLAQALSCFVTGLIETLTSELALCKAHGGYHSEWLDRIVNVGILAHFESLLGTDGPGRSLLMDTWFAVRRLRTVTVMFAKSTSTIDPASFSLDGSRSAPIVTVSLSAALFSLLPGGLQGGQAVRVWAAVVTQSLGEAVPDDPVLQAEINQDNIKVLRDYVDAVRLQRLEAAATSVADSDAAGAGESDLRDAYLHRLEEMLQMATAQPGQRCPNILVLAGELARAVQAVRFTVCGNGGQLCDMAVTLEQTDVLVRWHGLNPGLTRIASGTMRHRGVSAQTAFLPSTALMSPEQIAALPPLYTPRDPLDDK